MSQSNYPWLVVAGFGSHIRSTPSTLTIRYRGEVREYPLAAIRHLLVVGGHTMHTSVVTHLLKSGAAITFFDADGTPTASVRAFGDERGAEIHERQKHTPVYAAAVLTAQNSLKARLLSIQRQNEAQKRNLFYHGEEEFLHESLCQLEFLIKLDELRRMHRLTLDMYYEIMARALPPELGFHRRTARPHRDPVNAMLSLGYALLFGNCCVSIIGAGLHPGTGALHQGDGSLVNDLIDPQKPRMVDDAVFSMAAEGLCDTEYELSADRCHLSEGLVGDLVARLHVTIDSATLNANCARYLDYIMGARDLHLIY
ncbi:MAG: CRISPR-associated endonuclease Cas1 [Methanomicrobiaceae archaeon]|nr:CRISPR-associated endonuclease Cas1 [Methanomicrobiaceae archaeon]